jgi:hypothetical protein
MHLKIAAPIHNTLVTTHIAHHSPATAMELNAVINADHAIIDVRQIMIFLQYLVRWQNEKFLRAYISSISHCLSRFR